MRTISVFLAGLISLAGATAHARDFTLGAIKISDPWSRATPKGAGVGAGYVKITNTGTTSDRLLSGFADVAGAFQVHEMKMENGIAKMRQIEGGLEIKPGQTVELAPGSSHIMFLNLKHPFAAGDHIKATLVFEKAGTANVEFDVLAMGASPAHDMPGMKMPGH